jgi:hypothetical protein
VGGAQTQELARWFLVALSVLGLFSYLLLPWSFYAEHRLGSAVETVTTIAQVAGLYFAFSGDAKAWFRYGPTPLGKEEAADTFG